MGRKSSAQKGREAGESWAVAIFGVKSKLFGPNTLRAGRFIIKRKLPKTKKGKQKFGYYFAKAYAETKEKLK